ncbi:hypothetical protein [Faecalicatena orotica]
MAGKNAIPMLMPADSSPPILGVFFPTGVLKDVVPNDFLIAIQRN